MPRAASAGAGWTSARRCARRISGCCSRSICSPGSAAFSCRCISSPSPSISASTSSTPPRCSAWALSRGAGHRRYRHPVGLSRPRDVGDPRLRHLDPRRRLRPVHHQPRPAPAAVAARLLFRPDLGGARPGDHRQDRRSVSRGRGSARSSASSRSAAASARRSAPGARAGSTICPAAIASRSCCRSPPMPAVRPRSGPCAARRCAAPRRNNGRYPTRSYDSAAR